MFLTVTIDTEGENELEVWFTKEWKIAFVVRTNFEEKDSYGDLMPAVTFWMVK